ncbi:MAG: dihydrodipicolinate synthase family protein, partial [Clostridia bacterium]|nr:dihydrodipicolinate synthase family protein [Clostridia bacterium]
MSLFRGCGVSIITPLQKNQVDFTAFTRLIELQIASGTDAIITCDTTGEPAGLTLDERLSVIQFVVERVNGRLPVIAGVFANSTAAAVDAAKSAEAIGVDGLLVSTPGFSQPQQRGLIAHFERIANSVAVPMLLYNN